MDPKRAHNNQQIDVSFPSLHLRNDVSPGRCWSTDLCWTIFKVKHEKPRKKPRGPGVSARVFKAKEIVGENVQFCWGRKRQPQYLYINIILYIYMYRNIFVLDTYKHVYIYMYICIYTHTSSKGCCFNPKGWCFLVPQTSFFQHPNWKIQIYVYIVCNKKIYTSLYLSRITSPGHRNHPPKIPHDEASWWELFKKSGLNFQGTHGRKKVDIPTWMVGFFMVNVGKYTILKNMCIYVYIYISGQME